MFPFKLEVLSCFTVLFSSLGSRNKHQQTRRAFLPEAADGYPTRRVVKAKDWPPRCSPCRLTGVRLAGSPPASSVLNGPGTPNGALRNGSQFFWSTRRCSAKAVCESLCSLLLRGFLPFPSAPEPQGAGSAFQPPHRSCSLSPCASHGRVWSWMTRGPLALVMARAVLHSSRGDLRGSGLLVCSL